MTNIYRTFVARPMSTKDIERFTIGFLSQNLPEVLEEPTPLDVEALLDRRLLLSHGYRLELTEDIDPMAEAETDFLNRTIRFRPGDWDELRLGHHRQRFAGAHEAIHAILHTDHVRMLCSRQIGIALRRSESDIPIYKRPDWQANVGAAALLMPEQTLRMLIPEIPGSSRADEHAAIKRISRVFKVSELAATNRLRKLRRAMKDGE